jgi:hypothetical protein
MDNLAEREKKIDENPNLKFVFNKFTGNHYTLSLDSNKKINESISSKI